MKNYLVRHAVALALLSLSGVSMAGPVNGLVGFTAGTPAKAAEVNGNFNAVKTAVDDNDRRIQTLEAKIAALEAKLLSVSLETVNGNATVRFMGVNVQVVNGQGITASANGTGNLIVGYDEADTSGKYHCTIGSNSATGAETIDSNTCSLAGGNWTNAGFKSGSHHIVTGYFNNYASYGGVVFGAWNTSNNPFANVLGGSDNTASGNLASVSGGQRNTASAVDSSVSGGTDNKASGGPASVSGGANNTANGYGASVSGGSGNTANGYYTNVSGGIQNTVTGNNGSVSGGFNNTASGYATSISGGYNCNTGATAYKWIVGTIAGGCSTTLGN